MFNDGKYGSYIRKKDKFSWTLSIFADFNTFWIESIACLSDVPRQPYSQVHRPFRRAVLPLMQRTLCERRVYHIGKLVKGNKRFFVWTLNSEHLITPWLQSKPVCRQDIEPFYSNFFLVSRKSSRFNKSTSKNRRWIHGIYKQECRQMSRSMFDERSDIFEYHLDLTTGDSEELIGFPSDCTMHALEFGPSYQSDTWAPLDSCLALTETRQVWLSTFAHSRFQPVSFPTEQRVLPLGH